MSPITGKPIFDHVFHIKPIPTVPESKIQHVENGHQGVNGEVPVADVDEEEHDETVGDIKWEWARQRMESIIKECGLVDEEGVDRVVEACGAEDAMMHGIAICKQGGVCESEFPQHYSYTWF